MGAPVSRGRRSSVIECALSASVAAIVGVTMGCSDEGSGGTNQFDAAGGGAGVSSTGGVAGASGSGGGSGGSEGDAAADAASGGTGAVAPIYPVAVGYSWTYDVAPTGAGDACGSGTKTTTVVRAMSQLGRSGFELDYFCSTQPVYVSTDGDRLYYYDNSDGWILALDAPVEDGHVWDFFDGTRSWRSVGAVDVPAGAFSDCWEVEQVGGSLQNAVFTYCRGVGLVRSQTRNSAGDGSVATLISKGF